jgi:hypothetical protein
MRTAREAHRPRTRRAPGRPGHSVALLLAGLRAVEARDRAAAEALLSRLEREGMPADRQLLAAELEGAR